MQKSLKSLLKRLMPGKYQVPAWYWRSWLWDELEVEMKFLELLVRQGDRVIDVGGNRGAYAYKLWRLGAKVEVFEPNPTCFTILTDWAADKASVHIHAVALSSQAGSANLHVPVDGGNEYDYFASIENARFTDLRGDEWVSLQTIDKPISLQTLDSYGFAGVSLIKIDVEGHEYGVIQGAASTIAASRPALLIEIEQRHISRPIGEVFEQVEKFGYLGFFFDGSQFKALEDFDAHHHQSTENYGREDSLYINNFVFFHRARVLDGDYAEIIRGSWQKRVPLS